MKNNLLKYYIAAFYLCSTLIMFAQADPGTGGDVENDGTLDATPAAAPIDDYVWILALIGLVFVFMKFRAIQNKKINS
jgi:hypothetical protein